jgi:hypothetical protein
VAVEADQLEGALVGFRAGIAEEHLVHARQFTQAIGQRLLFAHLVDVGRMDQSPGLFGERRHQTRMGVTQAVDRNACQGVQVFLTLLVDQPGALAMREGHRQAGIGVHQVRHLDSATGRKGNAASRTAASADYMNSPGSSLAISKA